MYVDSTVKFGGPIYGEENIQLVGPDFFDKYKK
jgi:hypothetical protein